MLEDAELLHRYTQDRPEGGFAEFERRHIDLSLLGGDANLRMMSRSACPDLVRKAVQLTDPQVRTGWLCRRAQFVGRDVVRAERRPRNRDRRAKP